MKPARSSIAVRSIAAPSAAHRRRGQRLHRGRRGLSVVLVVLVLGLLIAFAALAVDVGRMRLAKAQLQTAADAAAAAAASGMQLFPERGVLEPQERAVDAADRNFVIDQRQEDGERQDRGVELIPDEDMQFGRWNDVTREFELLEAGGTTDRRRQADAVRVWTRRVTRFEDADGNLVDRGNGLPLILVPVLRIFSEKMPITGELQTRAVATLNGQVDVAAFVGLQYVRFTGATRSDSYDAALGGYPGHGAAKRNSSIATNGEVTFNGAATIRGSVFPGKGQWIQPQPLSSSVDISGYMFPLTKTLTAVTPSFTLPPISNEPNTIDPTNVVSETDKSFNAANNQTTTLQSLPKNNASTNFVFSSWTSKANDEIEIKNDQSPVEIWITGDFNHSGKAQIKVMSPLHPVTFHVNGDMTIVGNGVVTNGPPHNLQILMSRPNTTLRMGGSQPISAHVSAASSDVIFSGNGTGSYHFFGRVVGQSLTVASNVELHYDESLGTLTDPKFQIRLVE